MISIRKHLERLSGEEKFRKAFGLMLAEVVDAAKRSVLVADATDHDGFCASLDNLHRRIQEDASPANLEVVSALLGKTIDDHWNKLTRQVHNRELELKRIINLLTESAARLDAENKQFYLELRHAVQSFHDISQLDDITFLRKKLSEQVSSLQETVVRQEACSSGAMERLQAELEEARAEIQVLTEAANTDALTRLPTRRSAETRIRELVARQEPFCVAMAVVDRLNVINLRYGAQCGDNVLRRFSSTLRGELPPPVLLCRWGGPAFVSVCETMGAGEFRAALQKILGAIAAEPVEVTSKGTGFFRITSRYAVHQWLPGQAPEKVIRLIDVFCVAQKTDASGAGNHEQAPAGMR